ncbi:cytochrome-c peroxidase [Haloferula sp.]|uniref:cytochrome-c peroxidase n=1 Tax=Haloferula sp. TaxID=2497595 RepID=UPI003C71FF41
MKTPIVIALLMTPRIIAAESSELAASPTQGLTLSITDTENRVWDVQYATNPAEGWTSLGPVRVANSSLKVHLGMPGSEARMFFQARTLQNQAQLSSPANLLNITSHNYANPFLPDNLLERQIIDQDNTPVGNATTDSGAYLGRVLFYDKRLSANHTISCSSCHVADHGFSDPRKFSVGFEGGLTGRNSMGLTNSRYYERGSYFWDERAGTLEEQVLMPIQDSVEMGLTLPELVARISAEPFYSDLFNEAFGTPSVDTDRISRALAQFVRSIVSGESKFDEARETGFNQTFTAQENLGRRIFNGQNVGGGNATCATCHGSDNFVPGNFIRNNGLENPYVDKGLGEVTGRNQDEGRFKVPSLRNIELTAPYMHDGRFATLEEVVEFYNSEVVDHPNLAAQLREPPNPPGPGGPPPGPGAPLRLNLTDTEKAALVAFMKTLTDTSVISDPKFSDPFLTDATLTPLTN